MTIDGADAVPRCDCGYVCQGSSVEDRVADGQRHAREVHGIQVTADQVLLSEETS